MPAPRVFVPIAAALALTSCGAAPIAADLLESCGPLDGPAFEIAFAAGARTTHLYGPNQPVAGRTSYTIDGPEGSSAISASSCNAGGTICDRAERGEFVLTSRDDGTFDGTLDANFPAHGRQRTVFVAQSVPDQAPVFCG